MMNLIETNALLLADAGDFVAVLFLLIAILSALANAFGSKNKQASPKPQRQPQRPPSPQQKRLQNEIDTFLEEVGAKPKRDQDEEEAIVLVEDDQPSRLANRGGERRGQPQPQQRPPMAGTQAHARQDQPARDAGHRRLTESERLGTGVREHVSEHMAGSRVEQEVQEHFAHGVDESVSQHLGQFSATQQQGAAVRGAVSRTRQGSVTPNQLISLLRSREGIRQAILVNEVLGRPPALRR